MIDQVDKYIELLYQRGWDNRERLLRKALEELGELAEAIEYDNGSTNKIKKFKDVCSPKEKLQEEVCDVIMMGFALAKGMGLNTNDVLERIWKKLEHHQNKYEG